MLSARLAITSGVIAILLVALPATTARRPRYGGTLRVEIGATVASLDPTVAATSESEEAAKAELDSLIYDNTDASGTVRGTGTFHVAAFEAGKRGGVGGAAAHR